MVDSNDRIVSRRGTSGLFIVGIFVIIIGLGIGFFLIDDNTVAIVSVIGGIIFIISSFIFIIKQYERSIILRLGKFTKQRDPGYP